MDFKFISVGTTFLKIIGDAFMGPSSLCFVEDGYMLNLSIAALLKFYGFFRIYFKFTIYHRIFDFGKHIISVSVYNLNKLANFSA